VPIRQWILRDAPSKTGPTASDQAAIAGFGFLWVVWPAKLDSGPDTRAFFETFGGGLELTTKRQMLADLLAAVDRNDLDSRLRTRDRIFRWSFILLVVSLLGSLAVAMTGPALQFP
jgi:hypothetical protein